MVSLTNWFIKRGNHFHLKGNVSGHPKFQDGTYITSSPVEEIQRQGNMLVARTMSGTVYYMELAELVADNDYSGNTLEAFRSFGLADSIIGEAGGLAERKKAEQLKLADKMLENNELFLLMAGEDTLKAYFKSSNKVEMCQIDVHFGMVQDSILVGLPEKVDFRYFPRWSSCEVYHLSDGLNKVKIKNTGDENVTFRNGSKAVCVRKGEIKSLNKKIFANEGLFSPDCVNGKSSLKC
ncbi:MAG: hypothetical protein K2M91_02180 [Lachnospiraceae bacterium]|nr:hypothetical protein [Lachnospiraceae bacterium]